MKAKIIDKEGKAGKEIELPANFSAKIREDILAKVFEAMKTRQAMGSKVGAGAGYSASGILRHKRHAWKTTYGRGISRVPRKIFSRSGSQFNWEGATIASARGGRRAHPPKACENFFRKINKKEFKIAFNSALAGTVNPEFIEKKYDIKIEFKLPVVFESSILEMKSKNFFKLIVDIFGNKVLKKKSIRAGKGKLRGRKYKSNAGLLFVVGKDEKMKRKGVDVIQTGNLEISDLSPNGEPGRFIAYTEQAIKEIGERFK